MKKIIILLMLLLTVQTVLAKEIRVGILTDQAPIVYLGADGNYQGVAAKIWQEVARRLNLQSKYIPIKTTFDRAIDDLAAGKYDVLVGPFSITHQRLRKVDYTRPYFLNKIGLAIQVKKVNFFHTIISMFGTTFLVLIILFIISFIIFSHLFWYYERGKCKQVSKEYSDGIKEAMWTTISSFLRDVLYDPRSTAARIILGFWLFLSVIFMAATSAVVTATLTVSLSQTHNNFRHVTDLHYKLIGVEQGTTEVDVINRTGAKVVLKDKAYDALQDLADGKLDGVIGDYFVLNNIIRAHQKLHLQMSGLIFRNDEYAFVVPHNSKLRQPINIALKELQSDGFAAAICKRYITQYIHSCEF